MERHIGVDVHASSCTLAAMGPSGKRVASHMEELVVAGVRKSRGPKSEGTDAKRWSRPVCLGGAAPGRGAGDAGVQGARETRCRRTAQRMWT